MGSGRFVALLIVAVIFAETPLQQPPSDGRQLPPSAMQLATEAHEHYRAQQWEAAAAKYEAALAAQPDMVGAFFFLANSYGNLYSPARSADGANDAYLQKAIRNYRLAAERDTDPKMKKLATEYLDEALRAQHAESTRGSSQRD